MNLASSRMTRLPDKRASLAERLTRPFIEALAKTPMTPGALTWTGFAVTAAAAVLIIVGQLFAGGILVLVGSFFDMLDGALARRTNRATRFGGILDSVLDRFSEALLLLVILAFFAQKSDFVGIMATAIALFTSQMVSYLRARAEAAGIQGKEGIFTRAERVIVLVLGLLLSRFEYVLFGAMIAIAAFSFITVLQRITLVWRQSRD